ncbi:MAG TPA: FtsH protease activity modulator HflK [Candidatus Omnitrophota bacterium]|nr:FtsH protease activity modulator HflK [Candidatus Omnitrophota bacterium]
MEVNMPGGNMPRFRNPQPGMLLLIGLIALAFASFGTLIYTVAPDEVGVIQCFGKYVRTTQPGLHFKIPFGVETVQHIKVTHVFKEEFGFRTLSPGIRTNYMRDDVAPRGKTNQSTLLDHESLMLTGDLNVAEVEWIVQYRIKDPVLYAFKVRNVRETLRNMSEAIMRLVVGDHTINEVLTVGREAISQEVHQKLQEVLDGYQTGILITNVVLQDVTPPDPVKPSFNEVNEAKQEMEKTINQAWEEYNRVIPKAHGQAEQMIREAEGYALDRVNRAHGDAENFLKVWEAYKDSKEITRTRLYLETMKQLWPQVKGKYVIDQDVKGVLPFLNLADQKQEGGAQS